MSILIKGHVHKSDHLSCVVLFGRRDGVYKADEQVLE